MYVFLLKLCKIPVFILLSIFIANIIGLATLYSASNMEFYPLLYKQLMSFLLFILIAIFLSTVELKTIYRFSYHIYFFLIIILLSIELLGHRAMGATRWINLLGFKIQPSEFMKIGVILFLAKYYHNVTTSKLKSFSSIIIPIIFTIIPALIVIKQPDLGSGLIIILSSTTVIFASGIQFRHILYLVSPALLLIPIGWKFLHSYQKKRLLVFLNPESDPLGSGYNIIQSKIAIGSGGLLGKGIGHGTQSKLDFLPEHETDFIFSCFAEETGLVGSIALIFIYFIIIVQSLSIAANSRSVYGKILALGIVSIFFLHILINISMVSGIFPVTGKPLPFMSYGRNILGSMLIGFGLIMNVHIHQKENFVKS